MYFIRSVASAVPMRMIKSGTYVIGSSESLITGWGGDPVYPSTVIVSDALVMRAGTYNIFSDVPYTGSNTWPRTVRLMKSGVQLQTITLGPAPSTFNFSQLNVSCIDGDTLYLLGTSPSFNTTVQVSGCHVTATPV